MTRGLGHGGVTELRELALERSGGRCEWPPGCSLPRPKLQMAHLHGKGMGGSRYGDVLDNVAMLCVHHHDWLDCRITPNMRRFENEELLRHGLERERSQQ